VQDYDAVVIGAGHNGLTCAAYLGMAGLKVKVVEKRHLVGGAAVTEEFYPGFRNSVAAYAISLLNPKIIEDLQLRAHGLQIVERAAQNFLPNLDGQYLLLSDTQPQRDIAKLNIKDAQNYDGFIRSLDNSADVLRDLVLRPPPNLTTGLNFNSLSELARAAALLNRLRRTSRNQLRIVSTLSQNRYLTFWTAGLRTIL
jgi:phytoene dehydrogenase-like protein